MSYIVILMSFQTISSINYDIKYMQVQRAPLKLGLYAAWMIVYIIFFTEKFQVLEVVRFTFNSHL
jgi:hypothetical protein